MALYMIATPIGDPDDISLRALNYLQKCETVIGEELKQTKRILAQYKVGQKKLYKLNEHSTPEDVGELAELCKAEDICLVSDCGTPGFCDPGSELVRALRAQSTPIHSLPGASSLTLILSLSSQRIDSFWFRGFLPANRQDRAKQWKEVKATKCTQVFLETPYRLGQFIEGLVEQVPTRKILMGLNLTSYDEFVWEGKVSDLKNLKLPKKAEPIFLLYP